MYGLLITYAIRQWFLDIACTTRTQVEHFSSVLPPMHPEHQEAGKGAQHWCAAKHYTPSSSTDACNGTDTSRVWTTVESPRTYPIASWQKEHAQQEGRGFNRKATVMLQRRLQEGCEDSGHRPEDLGDSGVRMIVMEINSAVLINPLRGNIRATVHRHETKKKDAVHRIWVCRNRAHLHALRERLPFPNRPNQPFKTMRNSTNSTVTRD
jgi:hypothetical protein